jgi:uncharacterized protein YuzE
VPTYHFTHYFEQEVLRKRPYLQKEWCVRAIEQPLRVERQEGNRWRFWIAVPELEGRYLRVVTLDDQVTISQCVPGPGVQAVKLNYHADTDSLYIDLSEQASAESREISPGVVLDYDRAGNLVGIDIDNASAKVQLNRLVLNRLPAEIERVAG